MTKVSTIFPFFWISIPTKHITYNNHSKRSWIHVLPPFLRLKQGQAELCTPVGSSVGETLPCSATSRWKGFVLHKPLKTITHCKRHHSAPCRCFLFFNVVTPCDSSSANVLRVVKNMTMTSNKDSLAGRRLYIGEPPCYLGLFSLRLESMVGSSAVSIPVRECRMSGDVGDL